MDLVSILLITLVLLSTIFVYGLNVLKNSGIAFENPVLAVLLGDTSSQTPDVSITKDYSFDAQGKTKFVIQNSLGDIIIERNSNNKVEIIAEIFVDNPEDPTVKDNIDKIINVENSNILKISSYQDPEKSSLAESMPQLINYTIKVPDKLLVDVLNSYGDIKISNIQNNLKLSSDGGSIEIKNIVGNIELDCENSQISLDEIKGSINTQNTGGEVKINNPYDLVTATNSDGQIILTSTNQVSKDITLTNVSGNIELNLPKAQNGYFKAQTTIGEIINNCNLKVTTKNSNNISESIMEGQLVNNNVKFNLNNTNANINLQLN